MDKGTRHGRRRRLLVLPLLAALISACATQPAEAPPGYDYAPYGYYDVPPWDPYYDPWYGSGYDGFGYCCGWGPGFYGFYGGGGYYHGWGHGWSHGGADPGWGRPGGFAAGHGPGWGRAPWGGSHPFPRPLPPGAGRGGFRPHSVPRATHGFSHYHH
jgi:hypothetical protein